MGYKPQNEGFELRKGIFYRFCQKAKNHPDKKYFFIIDEINRGNLSKIFGELLMLVEKEYRETEVTLAYNGLPFTIPCNLYIIGMMNMADRSLAIIDYALRRRFCFVELEPAFELPSFKKHMQNIGLTESLTNRIITKMVSLNNAIEIETSLGKGFRIGHSYFCNCDIEDKEDWYNNIINYEIGPMLEEYWFDANEKAIQLKSDLLG